MIFRKFSFFIGVILLIISPACNKKANKYETLEFQNTEAKISELIIPTPGNDSGVVYGKITKEKTGKPPQGNLYLSRNITAEEPDVPAMLSFSYQTNPRAQFNDKGEFYFADVPPGVYAITIWTPPNDAYFVQAEDGQDYLWVTVEAGESLSMGTIQVP